jgi:hypothetical protein
MVNLEIRREIAADAWPPVVSLEVVTQASSLNCPAWLPACRSRRHGCPLDESGRMPELRGSLAADAGGSEELVVGDRLSVVSSQRSVNSDQ